MKYKNQIIILMIILILINSLINPIKINAAAVIPIGASMGAAAKAFLAFILASTAVGVTYSTLEDAKSSFTSVSDMTNEQLADWIFGTPPPPQNQGPPDKFKWYDLLGLGFIGVAVTQQLNDFITTFKDKFGEVQEGENIYGDSYTPDGFINGFFYDIRLELDNEWYAGPTYFYTVYINGTGEDNRVRVLSYPFNGTPFSLFEVINIDTKAAKITVRYDKNDGLGVKTNTYSTGLYLDPLDSSFYDDQTYITYNITNNAPVLDPVQNPPPEKIYLPYLPTLDPDNEKIKEVYLPTGDKRVIYDGTEDDYYTDIVNNIDLEQLQGPDLKVSEISIIDGQIVIDIPIDNPYPYPDLQPNPDLPENEQNMIPWIQVIINWISQIRDTIYGIVVPPEEYVPPELNFEPLKNIVILDKFPFSLPWDYMSIIEKISQAREAPIIEVDFPINVSAVNWYQDVKFTIDFEIFTPLANIMRTMLFITFLIGLIILTRTFIGGA